MFPFLWVPELSLTSHTSFSQQQLTTTEAQQFSKGVGTPRKLAPATKPQLLRIIRLS
jgi:hypothetical protein